MEEHSVNEDWLHFSNVPYDFPSECVLDFFVPYQNKIKEPKEKYPVLICTHGGGWILKNKNSMLSMAESFMKLQLDEAKKFSTEKEKPANFCIIVPSYRLSSLNSDILAKAVTFQSIVLISLGTCIPSLLPITIAVLLVVLLSALVFVASRRTAMVRHPVHVEDLACLVKWIVRNDGQKGMDASKIVLLGHSAGAHLVTLLATNTRYLESFDVDPARIRGVVAMSGVYSDKRLQETSGGQEILNNVFAQPATESEHENIHSDQVNPYRECFPIYHCKASTPPHLLTVSEIDFGLKQHAFDYAYALQQKGVYVDSIVASNNTHFSVHKYWKSKNKHIFEKVRQFSLECLDISLPT